MAHDWRTAIDMNDWMRDQERRTAQTERRPVPGLQTPATFARAAVRVVDWDLPPATINGYFYSDPAGQNSPIDGDAWIGTTTVDPAGFGVQTVWRYQGEDLLQYTRQFTSFTGTPQFGAWELVYRSGDGIWVDHVVGLNMPNVTMSVAYARYETVGNTLTYEGGVSITAPVGGQAFIDLPVGFDWGPGWPYLFTVGWQAVGPVIGTVRAIRQGVSWFSGDIIPYSMRSGGTPARAAIYESAEPNMGGGGSSGSYWRSNIPVTWQAGDSWSFQFSTEIARY